MNADDIRAIRERHDAVERDPRRAIDVSGVLAREAHADRAALLAHVDTLTARLAEVERERDDHAVALGWPWVRSETLERIGHGAGHPARAKGAQYGGPTEAPCYCAETSTRNCPQHQNAEEREPAPVAAGPVDEPHSDLDENVSGLVAIVDDALTQTLPPRAKALLAHGVRLVKTRAPGYYKARYDALHASIVQCGLCGTAMRCADVHVLRLSPHFNEISERMVAKRKPTPAQPAAVGLTQQERDVLQSARWFLNRGSAPEQWADTIRRICDAALRLDRLVRGKGA